MSFRQWLEDNNKRIDMTGDAWQIVKLAEEYAAAREQAAIDTIAKAIINNLQACLKENK